MFYARHLFCGQCLSRLSPLYDLPLLDKPWVAVMVFVAWEARMLDLESFKSVKYFSWSFRPAVVVRDDESIRGFVIPSDAPPGGWVKASPPVIEWEGRPMSKEDFQEAFADRLSAS